MGCAKSHAVIAAEYRAVGRNRLPRPQFTVLRRKPSRYRESHLGNCIQPQQVLPAWTEARGKQPEAATRSTGKGSLADMRIAGIDPIVTILSG